MNALALQLRVAGVAGLIALAVGPAGAQEPVRLTLGEAARYAAARSPVPEAARYRAEMAEARVRQQRAELLPSFSAAITQGGRTFNSASLGPVLPGALFDPRGQVIGPVRSWDARATLGQTILDFSATARWRAARAGAGAAAAGANVAAEEAAAGAAMAYVRALQAEAQLSARAADSALAEELLGIARRQREAGLGIALDVTRAQAQLAAARARLIAARAERARTLLELRHALGVPLDAAVVLVDSLPGLPTVVSGEGPAPSTGSVRTRADVAQLEAEQLAARRRLAAVQAERLPALAVVADLGRTGSGATRLLNTYTWGVQLSIPLFDGMRREARVGEQKAALRELDARRRDLAQQVALDLRVASLELGSAADQVAASDERLALAEQELALARRRFTEGVADNADVIAALLGLDAAQSQRVDARAALQLARVALARAQGGVLDLP